jgi:hypothetical protein
MKMFLLVTLRPVKGILRPGAALQGGVWGGGTPPHSSPTRQIVNLSRQNWIG